MSSVTSAVAPLQMPWQPCELCGGLGVEASPAGAVVMFACPRCGHEEQRRRLPFFSVTGPSGVGKSTLRRPLWPLLPEDVACTAAMPDSWRSPFAAFVGEVHMLALVCDEDELMARLEARARPLDDQAPADFLKQTRNFNRVLRERLEHVDTSRFDEDEVAARVADWIRERL